MSEITLSSKSHNSGRPPMRIRRRSGIQMESTDAEQLGVLPDERIFVKDAMSRSVPVVSPLTEIREAVRLMKSLNVGVLIVCNGSALIGMLSDRDIALATADSSEHLQKIMTTNPPSCSENDLLIDAHALMRAHGLTALPVRDSSGRLLG